MVSSVYHFKSSLENFFCIHVFNRKRDDQSYDVVQMIGDCVSFCTNYPLLENACP